jgi:hypothetical protein
MEANGCENKITFSPYWPVTDMLPEEKLR